MASSQRIKRLLDNWPIKIICFCLALLIYFFYQTSTLDTRHISVPLKIHEDGIVALAGDMPRFVRISLRGKAEEIAQILESDIIAYLDADLISTSGIHTLPVTLSLSSQVTLIDPLDVKVSPATVTVKLEERIVSYVPIRCVFAGNTAEGYILDSYTIEPEFVQITGIKSVVEDTTSIATEAIILEQLSKSATQKVKLVNINKRIAVTESSSTFVSLSIIPKQSTKSFVIENIIFKDLSSKFTAIVTAQNITVELAGEQNLLASFEIALDEIFVDCSAIKTTGVYELPLELSVPQIFTIQKITPAKVAINVEDYNLGLLIEDDIVHNEVDEHSEHNENNEIKE